MEWGENYMAVPIEEYGKLQAEVERLRKSLAITVRLKNKYYAEMERLREALKELACLGNGDKWGNSTGNLIAQKALKGPTE